MLVAEEGNVTGAVRRQEIQWSPPLSQQVSALESGLRIKLFKRLRRGVEMTIGGQLLLRDAQGILKHRKSEGTTSHREQATVRYGALTDMTGSPALTRLDRVAAVHRGPAIEM